MRSKIFWLTLRDQAGPLLFWGLVLAVFAGLSLAFYELLHRFPDLSNWFRQSAGFAQKALENREPANSPVGYLNLTGFSLVLPVLLALFAIAQGSATLARELERGRLEILLSRPIPRWQIWLEKYAALALNLGLLVLVLWAMYAWRVAALAIPLSPWTQAQALLASGLAALFFGGVALALGGLTHRLSKTLLISAGLVFIAVLAYLAAHLTPWLAFLRYLSPLHYAAGNEPLVQGVSGLSLLVLLALNLLVVMAGIWFFERTDIPNNLH